MKLPPNPRQYQSLHGWASSLFEFMSSQAAVTSRPEPTAVQLAHRTEGGLERAATDGILLYDPRINSVVYSVGGQWVPISAAAGSYTPPTDYLYKTAAGVGGAAFTATRLAVPFPTIPLAQGKYRFTGFVNVTNTSAAAKIISGYMALASNLTMPLAGVNVAPVRYLASDTQGVNRQAIIAGTLTMPTAVNVALVMMTNGATTGVRLGHSSAVSTLENLHAHLSVQFIGLNE